MLPGRSHLLRMWANTVSHADSLVVDSFCNDRDGFGMSAERARVQGAPSRFAVQLVAGIGGR